METDDVKVMRKSVYEAECSMLLSPSSSSSLKQHPAHLHIDILPEFQRQGWGSKLLEAFYGKMREVGVEGVHLGVLRQSEGALKFYIGGGWRVCGEVLDGGVSGEVGVDGRAVCLVRRV